MEGDEGESLLQQESVETLTSSLEPSSGDKRPREDEGTEQQPTQSPASRPSGTGALLPAAADPPTQSANAAGATTNYTSMGTEQLSNGMNINTGSYDALYIGDLQWVRLSRRLASCAYHSKNVGRFLPPFLSSGPRTKICDKLL